MPSKLPTDLVLLEKIYEANYKAFTEYSDDNRTRSSKIWVPIDIHRIADDFDLDPDIIFGRLYYHLNDKYAHERADGSKSDFFAIRVGGDHHCVNFPYLASIVASLRDEQRKFMIATGIASLSLLVSVVSIIIAVLT